MIRQIGTETAGTKNDTVSATNGVQGQREVEAQKGMTQAKAKEAEALRIESFQIDDRLKQLISDNGQVSSEKTLSLFLNPIPNIHFGLIFKSQLVDVVTYLVNEEFIDSTNEDLDQLVKTSIELMTSDSVEANATEYALTLTSSLVSKGLIKKEMIAVDAILQRISSLLKSRDCELVNGALMLTIMFADKGLLDEVTLYKIHNILTHNPQILKQNNRAKSMALVLIHTLIEKKLLRGIPRGYIHYLKNACIGFFNNRNLWNNTIQVLAKLIEKKYLKESHIYKIINSTKDWNRIILYIQTLIKSNTADSEWISHIIQDAVMHIYRGVMQKGTWNQKEINMVLEITSTISGEHQSNNSINVLCENLKKHLARAKPL